MNIIESIKTRASTRAFLNKTVSNETIKNILDIAAWAPSDKNTQPWQVAVVTGATKQQLTEKLLQLSHAQTIPNPDFEADKVLPSLYKDRAFACGVALYEALDIKREDKARRAEQWEKNFKFFDAPVGLFFFVDEVLGPNAWVDCGMFIQNVMLTATAFGLATCAQRSLVAYPDIVRQALDGMYTGKKLLTGMSLGYPDYDAPENNYRTARSAANDFTHFFD